MAPADKLFIGHMMAHYFWTYDGTLFFGHMMTHYVYSTRWYNLVVQISIQFNQYLIHEIVPAGTL